MLHLLLIGVAAVFLTAPAAQAQQSASELNRRIEELGSFEFSDIKQTVEIAGDSCILRVKTYSYDKNRKLNRLIEKAVDLGRLHPKFDRGSKTYVNLTSGSPIIRFAGLGLEKIGERRVQKFFVYKGQKDANGLKLEREASFWDSCNTDHDFCQRVDPLWAWFEINPPISPSKPDPWDRSKAESLGGTIQARIKSCTSR
ncbi:hypothetical protein RSK20926_12689 [Roseobacter sp. SK209-2-6]|uniref:hypothetical protein n=1 Tax=Roseobacter sp. SK209-2-6 TaxID=388739 RepID=UPI0000F3C652|nr:hypothetical protein [Roseobacter sp. SK209-2-6]EBA18579.1 hypothetical protein RSK20926_12689 [Roseobacter sp. SK209-2-6]